MSANWPASRVSRVLRVRHSRLAPRDDGPACWLPVAMGARCSSVERAFAHGAMGRRIDPSWDGPIELFLVPASAPRLV